MLPAQPPSPRQLPSAPSAPAPTQATPEPAAAAVTEPAKLWPAVLRELVKRPWMSWVESLELREWKGNLIRIGARTGRQDALKTISPQRREQLTALMSKVTGQNVHVEVEAPPAPPPPPVSGASGPDSPRTGPGGAGDVAGAPGVVGRVSTKQQAMTLPLVRQVMEVFNATLVEFKAIEPESAGKSDAGSPESVEASNPASAPDAGRPAFDSPTLDEGDATDDE